MFVGKIVVRTRGRALCAALIGLCVGVVACAARAAPNVVVSIAPVHALVAAVMAGVGSPVLLIPVGTSPHAYALRPSQRRIMASAQLLVWVGADLESFLLKPVRGLASSVRIVELLAEESVHRPTMRAAGVFDSTARVGHERHSAHQSSERSASENLASSDTADNDHAHRDHSDGAHGGSDPHVWLDPDNAIAIVKLVARTLIAQDPASSISYTDNARKMIEKIRALDREIDNLLADVRDVPYVVFHDAYRGFEDHYRLYPVAAIAASSAQMPGTRRVLAIRRYLQDAGVRCVFSEPQYPARLLDALTEGLDVRRGVLDPLGREHAHAQGGEGWLQLMRQLAMSLHACLSSS